MEETRAHRVRVAHKQSGLRRVPKVRVNNDAAAKKVFRKKKNVPLCLRCDLARIKERILAIRVSIPSFMRPKKPLCVAAVGIILDVDLVGAYNHYAGKHDKGEHPESAEQYPKSSAGSAKSVKSSSERSKPHLRGAKQGCSGCGGDGVPVHGVELQRTQRNRAFQGYASNRDRKTPDNSKKQLDPTTVATVAVPLTVVAAGGLAYSCGMETCKSESEKVQTNNQNGEEGTSEQLETEKKQTQETQQGGEEPSTSGSGSKLKLESQEGTSSGQKEQETGQTETGSRTTQNTDKTRSAKLAEQPQSWRWWWAKLFGSQEHKGKQGEGTEEPGEPGETTVTAKPAPDDDKADKSTEQEQSQSEENPSKEASPKESPKKPDLADPKTSPNEEQLKKQQEQLKKQQQEEQLKKQKTPSQGAPPKDDKSTEQEQLKKQQEQLSSKFGYKFFDAQHQDDVVTQPQNGGTPGDKNGGKKTPLGEELSTPSRERTPKKSS